MRKNEILQIEGILDNLFTHNMKTIKDEAKREYIRKHEVKKVLRQFDTTGQPEEPDQWDPNRRQIGTIKEINGSPYRLEDVEHQQNNDHEGTQIKETWVNLFDRNLEKQEVHYVPAPPKEPTINEEDIQLSIEDYLKDSS